MNYRLKRIAVSLSLAGKHSITGQTFRKQTHNKSLQRTAKGAAAEFRRYA